MRKIAVVGGGIFGCCAALKLSEDLNNEVTLYESRKYLLDCASGYNQYRIHSGYHYPRSKETALQSLHYRQDFINEFTDALLPNSISHYYCIARNNSLISAKDYIQFLIDVDLPFRIQSNLDFIDSSTVDLMIESDEDLYDSTALRRILSEKLEKVDVQLNNTFQPDMIDYYDVVINATYANINRLLPEKDRLEYQFEICQKPIVKLDDDWKNRSVVILDGPFLCIDPLGRDQCCHVIGHVKNAIIHSNVGHFPEVPVDLMKDMYTYNPMEIDHFLPDMEYFFPNIKVGGVTSMLTIRSVLPNRDHDDSRPSFITRHSDRLYSIFSGKIGTAIGIAKELAKLI